MDYRAILGATATAIAVVSYIPYVINMIRGLTHPHVFSWFIWGVLTGIAFIAQVVDGGGPGAWATGYTAVACLLIAAFALRGGRKDIAHIDWLYLGGAIVALILWALTDSPFWSVILITVIDALGFAPTFRKAFHKPFEETILTFALSAIKFIFAIAALENISVITFLYPASLVIANGAFVAMVMIRRNQVSKA